MELQIVIPVLFFLVLMAAISWYGYARYARAGQAYTELGRPLVTTSSLEGEGQESTLIRIIRVVGEQVPVSPDEVTMTRRLLIAAGYRNDGAVTIYAGLRVLFAVGLVMAAIVGAVTLITIPALKIAPILFSAVLGFYLPGLALERMIVMRQEELRLSLPDALDLMVVCVESGLGLDQAIMNVSRELRLTHKELAEELGLVNLEMRAGKRRADALRNLADRTGESEIRKLVAIMVQTDRFGTSMADGLRTHSDFMRVRRRQEAEERAGKVGVKLVFPIFFLILPSMLVVAAGPGMLQVFKHLFPMMRQFRI
ncbi:MAG: type II secretion system F family protein [Acidobacteria bacterium]|nr:type II secretion system F family protein [Acidobacteriota bacterium]